jgi:hypothetical protein
MCMTHFSFFRKIHQVIDVYYKKDESFDVKLLTYIIRRMRVLARKAS